MVEQSSILVEPKVVAAMIKYILSGNLIVLNHEQICR